MYFQSNDKLELTEKLTSEEHRNKELNEKMLVCESQLRMLADAIEIKDRELTQIRDSQNHTEKHLLQNNQLADRLQHYEALEKSFFALQNELQEARSRLEAFTHENGDVNNKTTSSELKESKMDANEILNRETAMQQLEIKFRKVMEDVANLQDEKQSLEHVVLQLQGETETIGAYIALYQHQRGILKQRAVEKEDQLKRLAADREEMKHKLEQLNNLVRRLMNEKGNDVPLDILEQQKLCEHHASMHDTEIDSHETAEQIINLLSEIKTSSLVQSDLPENFHPCPWCSGQLITV